MFHLRVRFFLPASASERALLLFILDKWRDMIISTNSNILTIYVHHPSAATVISPAHASVLRAKVGKNPGRAKCLKRIFITVPLLLSPHSLPYAKSLIRHVCLSIGLA